MISIGERVTARGRTGEFILLDIVETTEGPKGWIYPPGSPVFNRSSLISIDELIPAPLAQRTPEDLLTRLVAEDVRNPWTIEPTTAFSARAIFKPFQFRPLLRFYAEARQRLLIADEAGLGKTVEAGYIIAEGVARGDFRRALILCPSHLRSKWRWELRKRFGLWFQIVNGSALLRVLSQNRGPFQLIASIDSGRELDSASRPALADNAGLDLLVVDEVHKLIGRGGDTIRRDLGQYLALGSKSVIGLSATPVQLAIDDLQRVLDIVAPGLFDERSFSLELELTKCLNQLAEQLRNGMERVDWNRIGSLENEISSCVSGLSDEEKIRASNLLERLRLLRESPEKNSLVTILHQVSEVSQLSRHMTRAHSVDVGEGRRRQIRTVPIHLGSEERIVIQHGTRVTVSEASLYRRVDDLLGRFFSPVHRLQLSSSLPAMVGLLRSGTSGYRSWEATTESDEADSPDSGPSERELPASAREECETLIRQYGARPRDSKWLELTNELANLRSQGEVRKAIVFTHWIPTFNYLAAQFAESRIVPWVGVASDLSDEETESAISRFRALDGFAVLVTTDRLNEGVDLEEADCVINYDLPYNPQVIEQRIGRIDRVGQKSSRLTILSLITEGSLDERIYSIILERSGVFRRFIGEMRPITPEMVSEIDANETQALRSLDVELKNLRTREELMRHPAFAGIETVLPDAIRREHQSFSHSLVKLDWLIIAHLFKTLDPDCAMRWDSGRAVLELNSVSQGVFDSMLMLTEHENKQAIESTLNRAADGRGGLRFSFADGTEDLPRNHPMYEAALRFLPESPREVAGLPWIIEVGGSPPPEILSVEALVVGEYRFEGRLLKRREVKWWKLERGIWSEWVTAEALPELLTRFAGGGKAILDSDPLQALYRSIHPAAVAGFGSWSRSMIELDTIHRRNAILNSLSSLGRRRALLDSRTDSGRAAELDAGLRDRLQAEADGLRNELHSLPGAGAATQETTGGSIVLLAGFTFRPG